MKKLKLVGMLAAVVMLMFIVVASYLSEKNVDEPEELFVVPVTREELFISSEEGYNSIEIYKQENKLVINAQSEAAFFDGVQFTVEIEKTELIESISRAGKLTGNGNGMQYFGAILIQSELSLKELDDYYSDHRSNEWEYLVEIQEGQSIDVIDHETLNFGKEINDAGYYIVYSWESENSLLKELDIRGH